jgi:hypothetical protein
MLSSPTRDGEGGERMRQTVVDGNDGTLLGRYSYLGDPVTVLIRDVEQRIGALTSGWRFISSIDEE